MTSTAMNMKRKPLIPERLEGEDQFLRRRLTDREFRHLVGLNPRTENVPSSRSGTRGRLKLPPSGPQDSPDWKLIGKGNSANVFAHSENKLVIKMFLNDCEPCTVMDDIRGTALIFDMLAKPEMKLSDARRLFMRPVAWFLSPDTRQCAVILSKCYCDDTLLEQQHLLTREIVIFMAQQVARAARVLQKFGLRHNDLYPRNVIVNLGDFRPQVVIIDYGLVEVVRPELVTNDLLRKLCGPDGPGPDGHIRIDTGQDQHINFPGQDFLSAEICRYPQTSDLFSFVTSLIALTRRTNTDDSADEVEDSDEKGNKSASSALLTTTHADAKKLLECFFVSESVINKIASDLLYAVQEADFEHRSHLFNLGEGIFRWLQIHPAFAFSCSFVTAKSLEFLWLGQEFTTDDDLSKTLEKISLLQ